MPKTKSETHRVNTNLSMKNNEFLEEYARENALTKSALINIAVEEFREKKQTMELMQNPVVREEMRKMGYRV